MVQVQKDVGISQECGCGLGAKECRNRIGMCLWFMYKRM
jgi:hypothetical protein